jgi:hypothetical protein
MAGADPRQHPRDEFAWPSAEDRRMGGTEANLVAPGHL